MDIGDSSSDRILDRNHAELSGPSAIAASASSNVAQGKDSHSG